LPQPRAHRPQTATLTGLQTGIADSHNSSTATATGEAIYSAAGVLAGSSAAASTGIETSGQLYYGNGLAAGVNAASATARRIIWAECTVAGVNALTGIVWASWIVSAEADGACAVVGNAGAEYLAFGYTSGNSDAVTVPPSAHRSAVGRAGNNSTATATALKIETATGTLTGNSAVVAIANAIVVLATAACTDTASKLTGTVSAYVPGGAVEADGSSTATADTHCLLTAYARLISDANAWAFPNARESVDALSQNYSFATGRPAAVITRASGEVDGHSIAIYATPPVLATGVANSGCDCYGYLSSTANCAGQVWCKSVLTGTAEVWCSISGGAGGNSNLCGRGATKVASGCATSSGYGVARAA
jgi:hypothetical protein